MSSCSCCVRWSANLISESDHPLKGKPARAEETLSENFTTIRRKFDKKETLTKDVFDVMAKVAELKEVGLCVCACLCLLVLAACVCCKHAQAPLVRSSKPAAKKALNVSKDRKKGIAEGR